MAQTMDPNNMPILSEASVSVEIETEDMKEKWREKDIEPV